MYIIFIALKMVHIKFPFEMKKAVEVLEMEKFLKYYNDVFEDRVVVGPKKYMLATGYIKEAESIYNLHVRPDDVFVISYPRSGTTLTQELVWLINNDMDFEKAKSVPLTARYPFLEHVIFYNQFSYEMLEEATGKKMDQALFSITIPATQILAKTPSPRFIKSHLPISLLPANTLDIAKVVYVARDPRDVLVSYYHLTRGRRMLQFQGDFNVFFDQFLSDCLDWSPFLEHVKEGWELRNNPNVLFLFYEDLIKDMPGCLRRVAKFFGKQYTEVQFAALADHLHIDNFKKNASVDLQVLREAGVFDGEFVRKGQSKGWTEYLDKEMQARLDKWMEEGLRGSTLRFPTQ